jgi:ATP-dependent DNA helicase RecQ
VLVRTDEEAVQLTAVFRQLGLKAELIQDDNMIRLSNLYEVRIFSQLLRQDEKIPLIDQAEWEMALQQFSTIFQASSRRELGLAIGRRFAAIHPIHKYYSDWITFIRESHIKDFADTEQPAIYVSTIHKTKGKQFDNVFLLLNGFKPSTDEDKRLFYVAITRPKTHLA